MKEMKLHEGEEEAFKALLHNYLIMTEGTVKQIKQEINMFKDMGVSRGLIKEMEENLKQAKKNHEEAKVGVKYWRKKLDDSDDIEEVYIE